MHLCFRHLEVAATTSSHRGPTPSSEEAYVWIWWPSLERTTTESKSHHSNGIADWQFPTFLSSRWWVVEKKPRPSFESRFDKVFALPLPPINSCMHASPIWYNTIHNPCHLSPSIMTKTFPTLQFINVILLFTCMIINLQNIWNQYIFLCCASFLHYLAILLPLFTRIWSYFFKILFVH